MYKKFGFLMGFLALSFSYGAASGTLKTKVQEVPSQSKIVSEESAFTLSEGTTRLKLYEISYGLTDSLEIETNFWRNSLKLLNFKTSYQIFKNESFALKSAVATNYLLKTENENSVLFLIPSLELSFFSKETIKQHFYISYLPYVHYSGLMVDDYDTGSFYLGSQAVKAQNLWEIESNTEFPLIRTENSKTSLFITLGSIIDFQNLAYLKDRFYKASFTISNSWKYFQLGFGAGYSPTLAKVAKEVPEWPLGGFYPVLDFSWTF